MANTYVQLAEHVVFSTKNRDKVISSLIRERVEKYISGIISKLNQKVLAIYCMPDHCHILIGRTSENSIANLVREIKTRSSKFINAEHLVKGKFKWQSGYGAFSVSSHSQDRVIDYIRNQPLRHKKSSFEEEYLDILRAAKVDFDPKYVFD
jgi:REP element-mobilizing transposase RayT